MRFSPLITGSWLVLSTSLGCGQIEPVGRLEQSAPPGNPPAAPQDPAPVPSATTTSPPPPSMPGTCGAMVLTRTFATPDDQADALHGLWIACAADRAPALCPALDSSMFFGALDPRAEPKSRAAACGHLSSHGDAFIEDTAHRFTYEVTNLAPGGQPPSYALRVWNETTDRMFALSYRDDMQATGFISEGTITLGEPDGPVGTLRHSAFTTY